MEPLVRKALLAGGIVFAAMVVAIVLPALLAEKQWVIVLAPCRLEELLAYRGSLPPKLVVDADEARIVLNEGEEFRIIVEGCRGCVEASKTLEPDGSLRVRVESMCKGPQTGVPRVEITMPWNSAVALGVELGVGSLEADNVRLENLAADIGVGKVELNAVTVGESLSITIDTGDFEAKSLRATTNTRISIDIGVGRVLISLGSENAVVMAGSELGSIRVSGCTTGQGPIVEIDVDIGDVVVHCGG